MRARARSLRVTRGRQYPYPRGAALSWVTLARVAAGFNEPFGARYDKYLAL